MAKDSMQDRNVRRPGRRILAAVESNFDALSHLAALNEKMTTNLHHARSIELEYKSSQCGLRLSTF